MKKHKAQGQRAHAHTHTPEIKNDSVPLIGNKIWLFVFHVVSVPAHRHEYNEHRISNAEQI
jgi:hypothetical protein